MAGDSLHSTPTYPSHYTSLTAMNETRQIRNPPATSAKGRGVLDGPSQPTLDTFVVRSHPPSGRPTMATYYSLQERRLTFSNPFLDPLHLATTFSASGESPPHLGVPIAIIPQERLKNEEERLLVQTFPPPPSALSINTRLPFACSAYRAGGRAAEGRKG